MSGKPLQALTILLVVRDGVDPVDRDEIQRCAGWLSLRDTRQPQWAEEPAGIRLIEPTSNA